MVSSAQIIFPWLEHEPQDKWKVAPVGLLVEWRSRTTDRRQSSLICHAGCLVSLLQHPVPAAERLLTVLIGCDWIKTDIYIYIYIYIYVYIYIYIYKKKYLKSEYNSTLTTDIYLRHALFWVITRRIVAIPYRRFGTNYRSHFWNSWLSKMGQIGFPETSVRNYRCTLSNIPEEQGFHLLRGGSLKSRAFDNV